MIKSQDELNTCNDGKRKSDVRLKAIVTLADDALEKIKE